MIGRLLGLPRRGARHRSRELLAQFDLAGAADRAARTYSGGMRRRLDLAASLMGQPSVLYLDEPTTGLDPRARRHLWGVIRTLTADGTTVLLTTQYLEEADRLADGIVVIDNGQVVATGTPDDLKAQVSSQILHVSPVHEADVGTVAGVITDLAGTVPTIEGGLVTAPVPGPAIPAAVMQRLAAAGVTVAEFSLRRPSLDEVFLTLTGHRAGPDSHDGTGIEGSAA